MTREKGLKMPNVVPIVIVAAELDETVDALLMKLGDGVIVVDDAGVRCLTTTMARQILDAHRASEQARRDRDAADRQLAANQPNLAQLRVAALARQQAAWNDSPNSDIPAIARVMAADPESRFNRNDRDLAEQLSGEIILHRLDPNHQEQ
jgi:hypothetical protein